MSTLTKRLSYADIEVGMELELSNGTITTVASVRTTKSGRINFKITQTDGFPDINWSHAPREPHTPICG